MWKYKDNRFVMYGRICRLLKQITYENSHIIQKYIELALKRGYIKNDFLSIMLGGKSEDHKLCSHIIVYSQKTPQQNQFIDDMIDVANRIEIFYEQKYDRVYRV